MKKLITILALLLVFTGCSQTTYDYPQPTGELSDMSLYDIQSGQFYDITIDGIQQLIDNKQTAIIYMGHATCSWCLALVPVLNEVSLAKDMKMYYMDFDRSVNNENAEGVFAILDLMIAAGLVKEEDKDAFYFPTVLYIRQGEIIAAHQGTVSGHDATSEPLSEKQRARLQYQLENEFDGMLK